MSCGVGAAKSQFGQVFRKIPDFLVESQQAEVRHTVEIKYPVKMVHLVLNDPRVETPGFALDRVADYYRIA